MLVLLRYANLKARGIVTSWQQLGRLQKLHGFPRGRMLSPNARAWTEAEIEEWLRRRPVENTQPLKGRARRLAREAAIAVENNTKQSDLP